jgi:hypothetical protein
MVIIATVGAAPKGCTHFPFLYTVRADGGRDGRAPEHPILQETQGDNL